MFLLLLFSDRAASRRPMFCPTFSKTGKMFPIGNARAARPSGKPRSFIARTACFLIFFACRKKNNPVSPWEIPWFCKPRTSIPQSRPRIGQLNPCRFAAKKPVFTFCENRFFLINSNLRRWRQQPCRRSCR